MRLPLVYFIQASGGDDLIKIGRSIDLRRRFKDLSDMSPLPLIVIGITPCKRPPEQENYLHHRFNHIRAWGEWFLPADDLLHYISRNARRPGWLPKTTPEPEEKDPEPGQLLTPGQAAKRIGISRMHVLRLAGDDVIDSLRLGDRVVRLPSIAVEKYARSRR